MIQIPGYSMPEPDMDPPYMSQYEETAWTTALENRAQSIEDLREEILEKIQVDLEEVHEWDGDDPREVGEPDYADDEKVWYYRRPPYVRVTLKDGRIYYFTDGDNLATLEGRVDPADLVVSSAS